MKKLQDGNRKSGMQSKPDRKYKLTMYLIASCRIRRKRLNPGLIL